MDRPELDNPVRVRVDTPKGGLVKWREDGAVDYVSPLPCPFNYGCVPGTRAADGDAWDAVILGPRLARGSEAVVRVWAVIDFVDAGQSDPKLVCGAGPPSARQRRTVIAFFALYARLKAALNRARGAPGPTASRGWHSVAAWESAAASGTPQSP